MIPAESPVAPEPASRNNRRLTAFFIFSSVSKLGDQLFILALPLLFLRETNNPALTILSIAARQLPYIVSPYLGVLIDRYSLRLIYPIAQLIQFVSVGLIPFVFQEIALVYVLLIVSGIGGALSSLLNFYKLLPVLSGDRDSESITGYFVAFGNFIQLVGPILASVIILFAGTKWAVWLNALSFLVIGLGTRQLLPATHQQTRRTGSLTQEIAEGFKYFLQHREIRYIAVTMGVANLGIGVLQTLVVTYATTEKLLSVEAISVVLSLAAVMGILGSFMTRLLLGRRGMPVRIMAWEVLGTVGVALMLIPSIYAVIAGFLISSFSSAASNIITISFRRSSIPEELQGRVNSIIRMFISGSIPVSGVLNAVLYDKLPAHLVFLPVFLLSLLSNLIWLQFLLRPSKISREIDNNRE
jgi:MFS family permease